jgi:hypothetical protein
VQVGIFLVIGHAVQILEDTAGVRRLQTGCRSDDNSRKKLRNVRGDSSRARHGLGTRFDFWSSSSTASPAARAAEVS